MTTPNISLTTQPTPATQIPSGFVRQRAATLSKLAPSPNFVPSGVKQPDPTKKISATALPSKIQPNEKNLILPDQTKTKVEPVKQTSNKVAAVVTTRLPQEKTTAPKVSSDVIGKKPTQSTEKKHVRPDQTNIKLEATKKMVDEVAEFIRNQPSQSTTTSSKTPSEEPLDVFSKNPLSLRLNKSHSMIDFSSENENGPKKQVDLTSPRAVQKHLEKNRSISQLTAQVVEKLSSDSIGFEERLALLSYAKQSVVIAKNLSQSGVSTFRIKHSIQMLRNRSTIPVAEDMLSNEQQKIFNEIAKFPRDKQIQYLQQFELANITKFVLSQPENTFASYYPAFKGQLHRVLFVFNSSENSHYLDHLPSIPLTDEFLKDLFQFSQENDRQLALNTLTEMKFETTAPLVLTLCQDEARNGRMPSNVFLLGTWYFASHPPEKVEEYLKQLPQKIRDGVLFMRNLGD